MKVAVRCGTSHQADTPSKAKLSFLGKARELADRRPQARGAYPRGSRWLVGSRFDANQRSANIAPVAPCRVSRAPRSWQLLARDCDGAERSWSTLRLPM